MKIVVAMSGGVDSSVAAALLHSQGHEVIGVTLQLYDEGEAPKNKACCAGIDIFDAANVAEKIGIKHYVLNYESIFRQEVIDQFADSYLRGETPIPCINCNQTVKFRDLFRIAKQFNADALATGHYVRAIRKNNKTQLHKGLDSSKDQSYFLYATTQEQLDFLMFPIGELTKDKTRALAKDFQLEIANKPDSQDICFVPSGNYRDVVLNIRPEASKPGNITYIDGTVLAQHQGIAYYTVGQRKGLGISHNKPLYVVKLNPETNTVVVAEEEYLHSQSLQVRDVNWLGDEAINTNSEIECFVRLRSMHEEIPAQLKFLPNGKIDVKLQKPYKGITPGQACVFYKGTRVLGGGWIDRES